MNLVQTRLKPHAYWGGGLMEGDTNPIGAAPYKKWGHNTGRECKGAEASNSNPPEINPVLSLPIAP